MLERNYTVLRANGGKAYGVPDLHKSRLQRLLEDPDVLLWQNVDRPGGVWRPVKISHESLIVEAELPLSDGPALLSWKGVSWKRVACKRYRPRSWWKAFCWLFRRSRARCAWNSGRELLARGIATARPLAMCEIRRFWFRRTSYLFTEWIEAAENLHLYGWQLADLPIRQRLRSAARCAESLGRLIGRMHSLQIAHRDLKGANLLVAQGNTANGNDRLQTYLIDLDGVQIRRRLSPARRAANLARLAASIQAHPWVSRTVCCRFLHAYADQFPPATVSMDAVDWKSQWRNVAARSRRIVQRKRRRNQPVL